MISSLMLVAVGLAAPVKAFVLAGQSNMVGHGFIAADPTRNQGRGSLEHLAKDPATARRYRHLLNRDGSWRVRDDVWIHDLDRKGQLTVGYGASEDRIGPELGFGMVVGDSLREPVLLIKLSWGGKSLAQDFRPPRSGGTVGPFYTEVVRRTREAIAAAGTNFPALKGRPIQLIGFGWHQGWNDRIDDNFVREYERNMANFIRDIRKDLKVPDLPFVIAETGMGGQAETDQRALDLMDAQASIANHREFRGNVGFVGTRAFWRPVEESPRDEGYHWNCNAETYYLIGEGMGRAMTELLKRRSR